MVSLPRNIVSLTLVIIATVALFAQSVLATTPPYCCIDIYNNYNTAATTYTSSFDLVCNNCNSSVTSLGNFLQLTTISTGLFSITCTNCTSVTVLGNFPALMTGGIISTGFFGLEVNLQCTECPKLVTMGSFPVISSLSTALPYFISQLSSVFTCVDCPLLTTLGTFPNLKTMTAFQSTFIPVHTCTNCGALVSIGNFPQLGGFVGMQQLTLSPIVICLNCDALTSGAMYAGLGSVSTNSSLGSVISVAPVFDCTTCTSLVSFGVMSLTNIATLGTAYCNFAYTPAITCTNCPALVSMEGSTFGNFTTCTGTQTAFIFESVLTCNGCASLSSMGFYPTLQLPVLAPAHTVTLTYNCVGCAALTHMASLPLVTQIGPATASVVTLAANLNCTGCSGLLTASPFSALTSLASVNSQPLTFTVTATCEGCSSVTSFASFPGLQALFSTGSMVFNSFSVTATCKGCSNIWSYGDFPSLVSHGVNMDFSVQYICLNCLQLTSMGSFPMLVIMEGLSDTHNITLSTNYICTTCQDLTSFHDVSQISFGNSLNSFSCPVLDFTATCTSCLALTTFLVFSNFRGSACETQIPLSVVFTCVSCPALVVMGSFPSLTSWEATNDLVFAPVLSCENCASLVTLGDFSAVIFIGAENNLDFAPSLTCSGCPSLQSLGLFAQITTFVPAASTEYLQGGLNFSPVISCTDCDALSLLGLFSMSAITLARFTTFSPQLSCTNCADLITLGSFPQLSSISTAQDVEDSTVYFLPSISCANCPSLTLLASFPALTVISSVNPVSVNPIYVAYSVFSPAVSCSGCDILTNLADFAALQNVTSSGPTASTTFSPSFACVNCQNVIIPGNFPLLNTLKSSSEIETTEAHSGISIFSPHISCTSCQSVTSVVSFPLFPGAFADSSYPNSASVEFYPVFTCSQCENVAVFANLPLLSTLPATATTVDFQCLTCNSLTEFLPFISPLTLDPNLLSDSFTYTCSLCPEITLQTAGLYIFQTEIPTTFPIADGVVVGLKFQNVSNAVFPVFGPSLSRLTSLIFDNVAGLTDFDFLWQVSEIDSTLSATNCPDLTQVEGLRASLLKVFNVEFLGNPLLCPNRLTWLLGVATEIPIFANNGYLTTSCPVFEPVAPVAPSFLLIGANIQLTWINPPQPSIFVRTDLLMNGVSILSFTQAQALTTTTITQTIPGASYNFLLVVSLDESVFNSPSVTATVPLNPTGCQLGYVFNSAQNCTACQPGTFQLEYQCVPCQRGSYSNITASYSVVNCITCPAGTYASSLGSTSCSLCGGPCAAGSMLSNPPTSTALPFTQTSYDSNGVLIVVTVPNIPGLYYLAAFGGLVLVSMALLIPFKRTTKRFVHRVASVLRTPFTMLQVDPNAQLSETNSFFRGLVGIWVIGGVLVVTAYQIQVFVEEGRSQLTAVQPGTTYTSGNSTSLTYTPLSVNFTLYQTPVSCDSIAFAVSVQEQDSNAATQGTVTCAYTASTATLLVQATFTTLSFTPTSEILFQASSVSKNAIFCQAISYSIVASSYSGITVNMKETLQGGSGLLSGAVVNLYAIPTEYQYDGVTQSIGYTYTYRSSQVTPFQASDDTMMIVLNMPASDYFYQVKSVQAISGLQFVAAIFALAGGAITAGSLLANMGSNILKSYRRGDLSRAGTMLSMSTRPPKEVQELKD